MRNTLENLAERSRDERERFERLARKAGEAYTRVLKGPWMSIITRLRRPRQN